MTSPETLKYQFENLLEQSANAGLTVHRRNRDTSYTITVQKDRKSKGSKVYPNMTAIRSDVPLSEQRTVIRGVTAIKREMGLIKSEAKEAATAE